MRYVFGALALAAALVLVTFSATTLFTAAYTSMTASWAAMLAGVGIAAVVAWEAGAALLIGNCSRAETTPSASAPCSCSCWRWT